MIVIDSVSTADLTGQPFRCVIAALIRSISSRTRRSAISGHDVRRRSRERRRSRQSLDDTRRDDSSTSVVGDHRRDRRRCALAPQRGGAGRAARPLLGRQQRGERVGERRQRTRRWRHLGRAAVSAELAAAGRFGGQHGASDALGLEGRRRLTAAAALVGASRFGSVDGVRRGWRQSPAAAPVFVERGECRVERSK